MRSIFGLPLGGVLLVLWLLAGCAGPTMVSEPRYTAPERTPALTVGFLLAPVRGDGSADLQALDALPHSPAEELRRAFVLLHLGSRDHARQIVREVLFGSPPPSVAVESFAWYVRALVDEKSGDAAGANFARGKAAKLALDEDLRRLALGDAAKPTTPDATRTDAVALADLKILPRASWNALPSNGRDMEAMTPIWRITVHHSAALTRDGSAGASATQIAAIQREHMQGRGWGDIGYHFVIDTTGRIWAGRPISLQGAHAGDHERNRGNLGICLLGNFTQGRDGQEPTGAQVASLRNLIGVLRRQYTIKPDGLLTHRELRSTACPGERLQAVVERLRRELGGVAAMGQ